MKQETAEQILELLIQEIRELIENDELDTREKIRQVMRLKSVYECVCGHLPLLR